VVALRTKNCPVSVPAAMRPNRSRQPEFSNEISLRNTVTNVQYLAFTPLVLPSEDILET
jgi:hypothetical protein